MAVMMTRVWFSKYAQTAEIGSGSYAIFLSQEVKNLERDSRAKLLDPETRVAVRVMVRGVQIDPARRHELIRRSIRLGKRIASFHQSATAQGIDLRSIGWTHF